MVGWPWVTPSVGVNSHNKAMRIFSLVILYFLVMEWVVEYHHNVLIQEGKRTTDARIYFWSAFMRLLCFMVQKDEVIEVDMTI